MNELILVAILLLSSNLLAYMMGRFSSVNKAIEKQWGDQKDFHEWKMAQEISDKQKKDNDAGSNFEGI